ncbi:MULTISPECIES: PIG-L family deacetylase [unclassified Streptomyces]|uniref:PIG-L family deacetylase n=1 Tax=unclassified Streptomyces TaxID=2593676 RepID=UPI0016608108|nr:MULTISPECIES: PIG-L family deacetylase [unclassified Streptomyces]MBD0711595.1 PIG-L family deacetylase [Streptomyces sp. CBMA291]MBD0714792.1 PIG-L family deacetylase [Streptomyces sp. CBMA370]
MSVPLRRRLLPSRRRAVATAVTAVLAGGAFAGLLSTTGTPRTPSAHTAPEAKGPGAGTTRAGTADPGADPGAGAGAGPRTDGKAAASVVQIVAHPDDDLFFMNPDVSQSLRSGNPLAAVYLTAGESDGVNARPRDAAVTAPDKAGYAEARQNGIRAAYAEMATGSRTSPWDRTAVPTAGGGSAELDTLRAKPQVKLVWLQLREAGSINGYRPHSLSGLWHGRIAALESQRSAGTPVGADFSYTKEQVVATVAGLLDRFRPTFVRMQDPTPGTYPKTGRLRDHQDHLYGARFAQAALARYARTPGHPHVGVQNYLGYPTSALPHTLDPETAGAKLKTLETYAWLDGVHDCGTVAGCGDLKVAARPGGRGWTQTVRYARGTSTSWVQRDEDGGLYAFSVLDGRLAVWRSPSGGGAWRGPALLPGSGLDSGVTSAVLPDGRIAVYGTRTLLTGVSGPGAAGYRRQVVATTQTEPGGSFGPWRSLGTPERDDESGTSDISAPAVTVDDEGLATVLLRDSRHRLTAREQHADGGWGPWTALGGTDVYGDPVAATDAAGRGYVFASTPRTVLAWARPVAGGPLTGPVRTGLPATTLALSASAEPDGEGVRLWFRKPSSGDLRSVDFSGPDPVSPVTDLPGGVAGFGPVSGGDGLLAVRSRTGFLAMAPHGRPGARPVWTQEPFLFSGAPDAGAEGVAAIGLDGRLHWTPARG